MSALFRCWRPTPLIWLSFALHFGALILLLWRPILWPVLLATLAANHLVLTSVGLWPRSRALGPNWRRLPEAAVEAGQIALTIDDGPDPKVTPQVLDLLDRYQARATFFCIGIKAERYPELCREIVRRGHAVENHGHHHYHHFSTFGPGRMAREIKAGQDALARITGQRPLFFRPTAGLRNPFLDPVLIHHGLTLASWTRRGFDTRNSDAAEVVARLSHKLAAGDILLLHDGHAARTATGIPVILEALPRLLDAARAKGLESVTLRSTLQSAPS
jgi:peptidoglycan/xylan/chitin deacetylase (PgdA/CDA1 family)